jgi:hypothetical protein
MELRRPAPEAGDSHRRAGAGAELRLAPPAGVPSGALAPADQHQGDEAHDRGPVVPEEERRHRLRFARPGSADRLDRALTPPDVIGAGL